MSHIQNFWKNEAETKEENNAKCCGCSACASKCPTSAIKMQYDAEGFIYPVVDESICVACGLCQNVCPVENGDNIGAPFINTFAGYSLDEKIISISTSGGVITALSLKTIEHGGVVAGVRYSEDCIKAEYYIARTKQDVLSFASSKYVQSEKRDIYRQVEQELKRGASVFFVGCPCDVYAMRRYLGKEYDTLLTCELVCMGVSSFKIAEAYKSYVERKYKTNLKKLNARSKAKGWFVPHLEVEFQDGQKMCNTLYGTYLGYGMQVYNRPSCFACKFRGTNGVGDMRVGDFWGIKDTDVYWNPKGVSCIFVRTKMGKQALNSLASSEFALFETDYSVATLSNMSSHSDKSEKYIKLRAKFKNVFRKRGLVAACIATGTVSFWTKHIIPDQFHAGIKQFYHFFKDKR